MVRTILAVGTALLLFGSMLSAQQRVDQGSRRRRRERLPWCATGPETYCRLRQIDDAWLLKIQVNV